MHLAATHGASDSSDPEQASKFRHFFSYNTARIVTMPESNMHLKPV